MAKRTDYIGVFDSGLGGISVLKELVALMPEERYLYFGDSANAPYGKRTTQQVRQLTLDAAARMMQRGLKALVVACNTATSAAICQLRETYPELVVVGIEPAVKLAAEQFPKGHIGVMATEVTLREEKLAHQLERFPEVTVERIAAPGLVELIERGKQDSEETYALLSEALSPYVGKLDALVLGCTHYPFARKQIAEIIGKRTLLFDGGAGTARQTMRCLEQRDLRNRENGCIQMENSSGDPGMIARGMALLEK